MLEKSKGIVEQSKKANLKEAQDLSKYVGKTVAGWIHGVSEQEIESGVLKEEKDKHKVIPKATEKKATPMSGHQPSALKIPDPKKKTDLQSSIHWKRKKELETKMKKKDGWVIT